MIHEQGKHGVNSEQNFASDFATLLLDHFLLCDKIFANLILFHTDVM